METVPAIRLQQAAQLLGAGERQTEVAQRTGISASYLNELLHNDSNFQKMVSANTNNSPISAKIDTIIDSIELENWKTIHTNIAAFAKPHLALALARTVNQAKRRSQGENIQQQNVQVNVVKLELPEFIANKFKPGEVVKNANNEVVEISGHSMVTASAASLIEEAQELLDGKKKESYAPIEAPAHVQYGGLKFTTDKKDDWYNGIDMIAELGDSIEL